MSDKSWAQDRKEAKRLARDERTLYVMAGIFCADHHSGEKNNNALCSECAETVAYSIERTKRCPNEHKGNCEDCTIHCYQPEVRARIRKIMAYAGPRMLTRHPIMTFFYLKKKIFNKQQ